MCRYIDADNLKINLINVLDNLSTVKADVLYSGIKLSIDYIDKIPTADVQEVKHGKFISELVKKPDWAGRMHEYYQPHSCSNCHTALRGSEKYCPECGAKMDGDKE